MMVFLLSLTAWTTLFSLMMDPESFLEWKEDPGKRFL